MAFAQRHGHFIGETVVVAPPVAQVEVMGDPPQPGYIWESGYWNWVDGRHVWVRRPLDGAAPRLLLGAARLGARRQRLAHARGLLGAPLIA